MEKYKSWELWLKTFTLFGAVIAAIWTFSTYFDSKEKEFYTEFWNKKMSLFQKTSNTASIMATATNLEEFNKARVNYWSLFYGELSLVEGPCVKRAMQVYSRCIPKSSINDSSKLPFKHLEQPTYRLSIRLQNELAKAWEKPFSELQLERLPDACHYIEEKTCRTTISN